MIHWLLSGTQSNTTYKIKVDEAVSSLIGCLRCLARPVSYLAWGLMTQSNVLEQLIVSCVFD